MALRKPSNFFEDNNKSEVSESIKGTESFDTFQTYKKNVEKFDAISKFSGSLEDYNENVEKVNYLSQQLLGVQEEIKTLLTQEDLDRAMMSQLLVVEETAKDIQSRVKTINNERLVDIKENVKELTEQVNQFISIDVPKYKSLVINSENRSYSRYDEFEERISESINDIDSSIEQKYVEIDGRLNNFKTSVEENLSSIKVDVSKEVTTALESIESVNKNTINVVKAEFKETEVRTEEKINEVIDSYKKDIEDLNAKVKLFTETEIPKYSNLLIETKLKSEKEVKDLEEEVLSKVNILSEKVQFISEGIPEKTSEKIQELKAVTDEYKEEIDSISKKYQSLYKDFKEREVSENKKLETYSKDIEEYHKRFNFLEETVAEDLEEIQNVLAASNKSYHASLETESVKFRDKISEQMKGLEVDLVTNEKHIKKQNEHIEDIREEIKGVFDKLQLDKLEEKNASLSRKVNYIQEVLEKFNEKEVLTESITEPTTTNNSDPLTPTDQNFVTFDQLQSHYRLFLNRIQQQLSTLGGGGEVRLEFLDDIDRSTAKVDGKFLKYDSSLNKWVGATGGSGGGGGGISGVSTTGTSGFNNVNVSGIITASSFVKTSGTSSQFLKADGSIDSSTYITSTDGGNADQLDGEEGTYYLDYSNFSNTPTIPSNNNQLTNGAGFITTSFTNTNQLTNGAGFITGSDNTTGTSGGLTGTPDITVDDITAGSINVSGVATAAAFHTGAEGSAIRVTSNTISGPATLTIDPAAVGDNTGTVVIAGDLQIDGTTTTVNSTTMTVDDKNLELGTGAANDAAADGGGITIVSGEGNKTFNFEATGDNLGSSENLNIASGKAYKINNTSVLNATTLGSAVVNSSLTSVGTLGALTVSGAVEIGGDANNGTAEGIELNTSGFLQLSRGSGVSALLAGYTQGSSTQTVRINNDGTATFKGDLTIADKIIHDGDTNTAIRFPAADTFTVETGGSERVRVDSSGRLLVGTNSAFDGGTSTLLQVESTGGARIALSRNDTTTAENDSIGRIRWYGNDSDGGYDECARIEVIADADHASNSKPSALTFHTTASSAESSTERLRIDSSGNIGINCTSGGGKLAILANASTYEGLELQTPSGDGSGEFHIGVHQTGTTSGRSIVFKRGGADGMDTESLRIDADGDLLIGLTTGVGVGGVPADLNSTEIGRGFINLSRDDTAAADHILFGKNGAIAASVGTDTTNTLVFKTGTTERLRITSDGEVQATGPGSSGSVIRSKVTTNNGGYLAYEGIASNNTTTFSVNHNGDIVSAGTVSDSMGDLRYLGTSSGGTGNYTLVSSDAGKQVRVNGAHTITIPNNVFGTGSMITVVAHSSSDVTINQGSGMTLYNAGDGSSGNVTLAARTVCTIFYAEGGGSSIAYIAGGGIS